MQERALILIGQYDSPFVRRVAIAMRLYGIAFEHRPWSTFGDGDKVAGFNPLRRVPTLVLDDGEVLIESGAILDHLDETIGPERALIPARGEARRKAMKVAALGTGLADKAVSLFYERAMHRETSETWTNRCRMQIGAVLAALEADRASRTSACWFGGTMGHADIAVACAMRFVVEAHPSVIDPAQNPALAAHAERCEATEPFREIYQQFIPPA
jgi:glutathione S-transferase